MTDLLPYVALVMALLIAAGGHWIWKQYRIMRFLTEATEQLEGLLPGLEADMRQFDADWRAAWANPDWEPAAAYYGGPPCPELRAFYADAVHAATEDVRLFGAGAPADGLPLRNYMPLSMRFSVGMFGGPDRLPTDFAFAHAGDLEGSVYVVDWLAGGPVYHIGRGDAPRVRIADSLSQFLGWEHRPAPPEELRA